MYGLDYLEPDTQWCAHEGKLESKKLLSCVFLFSLFSAGLLIWTLCKKNIGAPYFGDLLWLQSCGPRCLCSSVSPGLLVVAYVKHQFGVSIRKWSIVNKSKDIKPSQYFCEIDLFFFLIGTQERPEFKGMHNECLANLMHATVASCFACSRSYFSLAWGHNEAIFLTDFACVQAMRHLNSSHTSASLLTTWQPISAWQFRPGKGG